MRSLGIEKDEGAAIVATQHLTKVIHVDVEALEELPLPLDYIDCLIFGDVLDHLLEPVHPNQAI
ncbi:MAG: hypothetical protein JNJ45_09625 [Chthonomonas sp.]|nr:hypothetical protein [Chthonomonas sp.]